MYYIQTFKIEYFNKNTTKPMTLSSIVSDDYMGSFEFENGSVPRSIQYLKDNEVKIFTHSVIPNKEKEPVTFYVITSDEGFEAFKKGIDIHLDGHSTGMKAKEHTYLYDKFVSSFYKEKPSPYHPDMWLDVTMNVSRYNTENGYSIMFSDKLDLIRRLYLYLKQTHKTFNAEEVRIGDMVYVYNDNRPKKVCGLNEGNSISLKARFGKAQKYHPDDLWSKEDLLKLPVEVQQYFEL